jgi:Fe-S cluster biogenesis protein NfuA/nitrite reductase/ring-hydroxylating ferredoxin subunit
VDNQTLRETSERIDEVLDELGQSAVPAVMNRVEELLRSVMTLYGAGLGRALDIAHDAGGEDLVRRLADDEVVGNLLVLHDLHPDDVLTRVQAALDRVRPYLGSHAGGVELLGVDADGVAHLRLEGSCDGCQSSALTVRSAIEDAILVAAPDVVAVEAQGMVEPGPTLLQIQPFASREEAAEHGTSAWQHLELDVPPRTLTQVSLGGARLAVANLDGTLVAYLDQCPSCGNELSRGALSADLLTCTCGRRFDARRAGRASDDSGTSPMVPVPLLPEHGGWKAAVPQGAVA